MATRRPSYIPCDTSAHPPLVISVEPSEQSGMCIDFGITRCRLQVLQSLLNNLSRSWSDITSFSRRCSLVQSQKRAEKMEGPALSISLTSLSISGSGTCRNWNREAIRGRNLPRRCCPVSMFRNFQLGFRVFRVLQLPELAFWTTWRLDFKNNLPTAWTSHRFFGSSLQQVVIISHTLRRNH